MSSICMRIKYHLNVNGFTLSLALKQRLKATRHGLLMMHTQDTQHIFPLTVLNREQALHCNHMNRLL